MHRNTVVLRYTGLSNSVIFSNFQKMMETLMGFSQNRFKNTEIGSGHLHTKTVPFIYFAVVLSWFLSLFDRCLKPPKSEVLIGLFNTMGLSNKKVPHPMVFFCALSLGACPP